MNVTMLLCDFADAANGKLYVMGGGWTLLRAYAPAPVALAIVVAVPWDQTNVKHELEIELVDEDGQRVSLGQPPREILQKGQFEAGRPPGLPPGTSQAAPLAFRFAALPLPPGGYSFVLTVDGEELARSSFRAIGAKK